MNYLIILLTIICGYNIYRNRGQKRFDWFVCSMMLFSSSIIILEKPQIPCHRLFLICYWLSVLKNKEYIGIKFPLKWPLAIYVVGILVVSFSSVHVSAFYKVYKPFAFLIDSYFILLLARYGVTKESFLSKKIVYTLLFVTAYGVLTLAIRSNPIQSFVASSFGKTLLDSYYWGSRTRITSTWSHPIAYGLVCAALFYEYIPYWKNKKVLVLMMLLVMNVLVCGSRTALAAFLLMGCVIVLTKYRLVMAVKQAVVVCLLAIPVYLMVPIVHEKVDSVVNTAMGNDDVGGSSLEMRDEQTYYAMLIVSENPVLGHGFDYVMEGMGYGTNNFKGDWHLLGLESYFYILLIERGFVGLFLEIFLWVMIALYAYKNRRFDNEESSLVLAFIVGFAFFSVSTGVLDTKIPMMFLVGVALSKMSQEKQITMFNTKRNKQVSIDL